MTITALPGMRAAWPAIVVNAGEASIGFNAGNITFDATTDRYGKYIKIPKTGSLLSIHWRTGTITTGCTMDVRLETASNGRPSGTLYSASPASNASVVVANTDDNTVMTATLNSPTGISVTQGADACVVFAVSSGTPNAAGMLTTQGASNPFPAGWFDNGGAGYAVTGGAPAIVLEYTDGAVAVEGLWPFQQAITGTTYNSGSTPDEYALRFQVPMTMRIAGAAVLYGDVTAGADVTVLLENGAGTVLASASLDGNHSNTSWDGMRQVLFNTSVTLSANTTYYLSVRPDTANNITLRRGSYFSTSLLGAYAGSEVYEATRTNGGAWSTSTSTVPFIHLLLDGFDDGAGGGGAEFVLGV